MEKTIHRNENWPPQWETGSHNSYGTEEPCKYVHAKNIIGDGTYSSVFECKNKVTGAHYAAKRYKKTSVYGLEEMLQNEFSILSQLSSSHPNIVTIVDYFETADYLYLVTALASGGDLFERIISSRDQRLDEQEAASLIRTLVSTVEFLHGKGVVHRDLKAENILFSSKSMRPSQLLLADFGSARFLKPGEKLHDMSGTLSYMAPEVLDKQKGHGFEADIWSIGVMLYFCLCGYMPFDCETDDETKEAISKADYRFEPEEYWTHISAQAKDFLRLCFKTDPNERPTAQELLAHPFISPPRRSANSTTNLHSRTSSMINMASNSTSVGQKLHEFINQLQLPQNPKNIYFARDAPSSRRSHDSIPSSPSRSSRVMSHDNISSFASQLSLLEKSRKQNLAEGTTLQGAFCSTPDVVSCFTTPICSTSVSRETSMSNMDDFAGKPSTIQLESKTEVPKFFI